MGEIEYSRLLYADMVYKNKDGEVVFSMKRKDGYNSLYYIFELNEENMTPEEILLFAEAFEAIKMGARMMDIPLYDSKELMDGVSGQIQVLLGTKDALHALKKADKTEELVLVRDVDVKVFDHATGKINSITVGISVPPGAGEYIEKLLAEQEVKI